MQGETQGADMWVIDQSACDHQPADQPLQAAEGENAGQPPAEALSDAAPRSENDQRQEKHRADQPPEQAMKKFRPENFFEFRQRHATIDLLELRRLLVRAEFLAPLDNVQRRQYAVNRFPARNRQPRPGQPRIPADTHHRRNQ